MAIKNEIARVDESENFSVEAYTTGRGSGST